MGGTPVPVEAAQRKIACERTMVGQRDVVRVFASPPRPPLPHSCCRAMDDVTPLGVACVPAPVMSASVYWCDNCSHHSV